MTPERRKELMCDLSLELTEDEVKEGYHFCLDWDGLLIHEDDRESECCTCPFGVNNE
jgi:hypothetical protein